MMETRQSSYLRTHLRFQQVQSCYTEIDILKLAYKTSFSDPPEDFRKEQGFNISLGLMFLLKSIFQSPVDLFHPLGWGSLGGLLFLCPKLCIFSSLAWGFLRAEEFSMKELHLWKKEKLKWLQFLQPKWSDQRNAFNQIVFALASFGVGNILLHISRSEPSYILFCRWFNCWNLKFGWAVATQSRRLAVGNVHSEWKHVTSLNYMGQDTHF